MVAVGDAVEVPTGDCAPLVSIVVVAYNARQHLARCLRSLLAQSYPRVEILVVDNASGDGSTDEVAAHFPQVRLLRAGRNLGYAGGNNLGVAHARGDYVAMLNPDTEAEPGWLAALVDALEEDPSSGLATSKILLFNQRDRVNACGNDVHYTGLAFCRGLGCAASAFTEPEEVPAVSGAAFIIRRNLFKHLGGFDERFFMYLEDTDLSWRAALAGFRCVTVPDSIVYHHYATQVGAVKTFHLERNRYMMLLQNCHPTMLLLLLPALVLAEVVTWGYALLRGPAHMQAKLRAYFWVARHTSDIARRRRYVQRTRQASDGTILRCFGHRLPLEQLASGRLLALGRTIFDVPLWAWYRAMRAVLGR
jgi:GT2 family glycosyltransferase